MMNNKIDDLYINYKSDNKSNYSSTMDISNFVKFKLPLHKEQLIQYMSSEHLGISYYSSHNCPTLFKMFHYNKIQKVLQITYNIAIFVEDIQKKRQEIKSATGLDRIRIPMLYKKIAFNVNEINQQLKLFGETELPDVKKTKSRYAAAVLRDMLEAILSVYKESKNNSSAFLLVIKTLTPELEEKLHLYPKKIESLKEQIQIFDKKLNNSTKYSSKKFQWSYEWQQAEKTLKNLYSKFNINFPKLSIFHRKDAPLTSINEECIGVEENNL